MLYAVAHYIIATPVLFTQLAAFMLVSTFLFNWVRFVVVQFALGFWELLGCALQAFRSNEEIVTQTTVYLQPTGVIDPESAPVILVMGTQKRKGHDHKLVLNLEHDCDRVASYRIVEWHSKGKMRELRFPDFTYFYTVRGTASVEWQWDDESWRSGKLTLTPNANNHVSAQIVFEYSTLSRIRRSLLFAVAASTVVAIMIGVAYCETPPLGLGQLITC